MQALLPEGYPFHQFNLYKGVTNIALIIVIRKICRKPMFLLLIHSRKALNNLKYAVGKGVSLSFIDKECNFGVMHKQYAET